MFGIVQPRSAGLRLAGGGSVRICEGLCGDWSGSSRGDDANVPEKQLSAEQSRQVAGTMREEIARRRISRQQLADQAKISISTLEKALAGRRPFTLATTVRLEEALGVSLRKHNGDAARSRPCERRRRAGRSRLLFAPRGVVDRGHLSDAAARRSATRTRSTPTAPRSSGTTNSVEPDLSRSRTARRGLHPVRRRLGAEPVRPHLSRHQPAAGSTG